MIFRARSKVEETIRDTVEGVFTKLTIQGRCAEKMLKDRAHDFLEILEERARQGGAIAGITFGLPGLDEIVGRSPATESSVYCATAWESLEVVSAALVEVAVRRECFASSSFQALHRHLN